MYLLYRSKRVANKRFISLSAGDNLLSEAYWALQGRVNAVVTLILTLLTFVKIIATGWRCGV
jgi:hypothetical protein